MEEMIYRPAAGGIALIIFGGLLFIGIMGVILYTTLSNSKRLTISEDSLGWGDENYSWDEVSIVYVGTMFFKKVPVASFLSATVQESRYLMIHLEKKGEKRRKFRLFRRIYGENYRSLVKLMIEKTHGMSEED